jgi:hypothetical protein
MYEILIVSQESQARQHCQDLSLQYFSKTKSFNILHTFNFV